MSVRDFKGSDLMKKTHIQKVKRNMDCFLIIIRRKLFLPVYYRIFTADLFNVYMGYSFTGMRRERMKRCRLLRERCACGDAKKRQTAEKS